MVHLKNSPILAVRHFYQFSSLSGNFFHCFCQRVAVHNQKNCTLALLRNCEGWKWGAITLQMWRGAVRDALPSSGHASVRSASYSWSFVRIWSEIKFKLSLGQSGASYIQKIINLSVSESVMHEKKIYFFGAFLTYFIGGKLNTVKDMRWLFSHSKKGLYIFRCCGPNPFVSGIICRFRILKK